MGTAEKLIDYAADVWLALKGIAAELDAWNAAPRSGRITLNPPPRIMIGDVNMTITPGLEIPAEDVPAKVDWFTRLGTELTHDKTTTTWSVEDQDGGVSTAVSVDPNLDTDADDETALVTFNSDVGQFRLVATTPGKDAEIVRAESALYTITLGAPAIGVITLNPT
jgi:hypothetical protein